MISLDIKQSTCTSFYKKNNNKFKNVNLKQFID